MIPTPADPYEEWMQATVAKQCEDPRFEVRRARPEDFPRIYDTVDQAFGKKRPRAVYDWLYLQNPFGIARCWITILKETDELLKTGADYPWPIWRGSEVLRGTLGGDSATLPHWQRKGLSHVRRPVTRSHPWWGTGVDIAGPNAGSRAVTTKSGRENTLLGDLPGGVLLLRSSQILARLGLPGAVARPLGAAADGALSLWYHRSQPPADGAREHVEQVRRFDGAFDEVTERCMAFPMYWCPHNAGFLNWRYLDHPGETYVALALVEDERPVAYAVLRLDARGGTLAEFAVEPGPRAERLLDESIRVARDAGCGHLSFFGTPGWNHWPLLRRSGFLPYRTRNHIECGGRSREPEVNQIENWQILPGDRDYH